MSAALLVLNPRYISKCIEAIKALDIPVCWLSYMTEERAAKKANEVIAKESFDRYLVLSDDTVPTQKALDLVLEQMDQGHPVVTGYCNLDTERYADLVNLTINDLPPPPITSNSYHLMTRKQVEQHYEPIVPTTFAGLALTGATREVWQHHPLKVDPDTGGQMDYHWSLQLAESKTPIVAARHAYIEHVKERWCFPDRNPEKRLLVGERKARVRWTNIATPV